jgi:tetratricopeptide (TPR) repeat protein
MKRTIRCLVVTLQICLLAWSVASAGGLEDRLMDEAMNNHADAVRALIEKGANVNAKDWGGATALMLAAHYGYADVVRVLIEKGADLNMKDGQGATALDRAEARHRTEVAAMLRAAMSSRIAHAANSRETFDRYLSELREKPYDKSLLKQIILMASAMTPSPAIPDQAQRSFIQGNAFMKAAKNVGDYNLAIDNYREALKSAPWWGDVYYNLAIALNAVGNSDGAVEVMGYYVFANPKDADQAKKKIYEIEAQGELRRKQEDVMRARYGGARGEGFDWESLYRYGAITQNMSFDASGRERVISLKIITRKEDGLLHNYFQIADMTSERDTFVQIHSTDWRGTKSFYLDDRTVPNQEMMTLTVTPYGDADATITLGPANNASPAINTTLTALFKERASQAVYAGGKMNVGGKGFYILGQGGTVGSVLFFPMEIKNLLESGSVHDLEAALVANFNYYSNGQTKKYHNPEIGEINGSHYHLEEAGGHFEAKEGPGDDR